VYQFFKEIFLMLHFCSYLLSNLHQKYWKEDKNEGRRNGKEKI